MTDREFRQQQARVLRAYRKWAGDAGLNGLIVCHVWLRDRGQPGYEDATAHTGVSWEYCHVTFNWVLGKIALHNDAELDRIIRHEISHVLVAEMREWGPSTMSRAKVDAAMKHEERVVTQLAAVLKWCRESGERAARPRKKGRKSR